MGKVAGKTYNWIRTVGLDRIYIARALVQGVELGDLKDVTKFELYNT